MKTIYRWLVPDLIAPNFDDKWSIVLDKVGQTSWLLAQYQEWVRQLTGR